MPAGGGMRTLVDGNAWGARWSNKGNEIALVTYSDNGPNISINDTVKGEGRTLLDKKYQQIYWGEAWSPDDKWICFYRRFARW